MSDTRVLPKLSYSLREAAAATGLSPAHIDRQIRSGALRAKRSAKNDPDTGKGRGNFVILAADLQSFLDALTEA